MITVYAADRSVGLNAQIEKVVLLSLLLVLAVVVKHLCKLNFVIPA